MYDKSLRVSVNNREKGNKAYNKKDFAAALLFYNKAIAFAPTNNENLSLAYGNRSAVFFELKMYDECLKNIRLARKHGYPSEKSKTLKEREEKAKELLKADQKSSDVKKFFKLSYECNPKIPFIIDRLIVKESCKFGRGIYTKRNLKPGDVIAIEKPLISIVNSSNDARYKHCCNCMKSAMMNLIPCTKTAAVMYCSEVCREKTLYRVDDPSKMISDDKIVNGSKLSAVGIEALGNVEKFQKFVENYQKSSNDKKTIFDFDLSNPKSKNYKKNLLSCILSLNYSHVRDHYSYKELGAGGIVKFLSHLAGIVNLNSLGLQYLDVSTMESSMPVFDLHGSAVLAFGSLLNHSCDPNVQRIVVDDEVVFIVCKPIEEGEQLFINYVGDFYNCNSAITRQDKLDRYDFECECDACEYGYSRFKLIQPYKGLESPNSRSPPKTVEKCLEELRENFKFIDEHGYNILTLANYERIQRNLILLAYVAYHATFPY